jgi:phage terminase large subunit-like protein
LRHIEGAMYGEPFELEPWQEAVVGNLFGWKRRDAKGREIRRYRKLFLFVPRKNGKTPLAAGIGLYVLFCDPERGQQGYVAAADREQAGMLFRHAKGMVEFEPELDHRAVIYGGTAPAGQSKSIVRSFDGSFLRVISADADSKHGGNLSIGIVDELHAQPNRKLVDVLVTSMASANRPQPLLIYITTADYDRPSICNEEYDYAAKVRDGIVEDVSYLPVIYEATKNDDWTSEEAWQTSNPNLGVSVSGDYLRAECRRAQENPAFENEFKRLHLNIRTEQSVRLIQLAQWDACDGPVELDRLAGQPAFAAMDLSTVDDLSALCLVWRDLDEYLAKLWLWLPRATAERRQRQDRVEYLTWAQQGLIEVNEGN